MQRGSVSVLKTVAEFATDSDFAQTPNYVDSGAPPIKFALLLGLGLIIRCSRMANDTRWHPKSLTMMPVTSILWEVLQTLQGRDEARGADNPRKLGARNRDGN